MQKQIGGIMLQKTVIATVSKTKKALNKAKTLISRKGKKFIPKIPQLYCGKNMANDEVVVHKGNMSHSRICTNSPSGVSCETCTVKKS